VEQSFHSDIVIQLHEELINKYNGIQGIKSKGNVGFCMDQISAQFFNQDNAYPTRSFIRLNDSVGNTICLVTILLLVFPLEMGRSLLFFA
jgi:hypothetical protein